MNSKFRENYIVGSFNIGGNDLVVSRRNNVVIKNGEVTTEASEDKSYYGFLYYNLGDSTLRIYVSPTSDEEYENKMKALEIFKKLIDLAYDAHDFVYNTSEVVERLSKSERELITVERCD